ncbi:MAG: UDP-N-acetylmuramoyl-tripeptide--D-alanyl-D-alanine ligase [Mariprofundaceae bacterium]
MRMSGLDLQQSTRGQWHHGMPDVVYGLSTDSRYFEPEQAFLALRGPHFNGHEFAHQIADRASALIGDREGIPDWHDIALPQLEVQDTLIALGDIAAAWRNRLGHTRVIAITGSYGKTSVRSMLSHILQAAGFCVSATRANRNNLIGVPLTLLDTSVDTDIALIECGISEQGEMDRLASIVQPDVVVLTGLAAAHGEGLGGLGGIVQEKHGMLAALRDDGWCALGAGVEQTIQEYGLTLPASYMNMDTGGEHIVRWQLDGTELRLSNGESEVILTLALPARHWADNMALAATVALQLARSMRQEQVINLPSVAESLGRWRPVAGRMQILAGPNGSTILDDSYNANPASMQAAIDTLTSTEGRHIAILGDMGELGGDAAALHAGLDTSDIDMLLLAGPMMQQLANQSKQAQWLPTTDKAIEHISQMLEKGIFGTGDYILVKASRSMQFDRIVSMLTHTVEASRAV